MGNPLTMACFIPLAVAACLILPTCQGTKKDNCEYDMDLTKNVIKITCEGSSSSVNVYADTAHVTGEEEEENEEGGNAKTKGSSTDGRTSRARSLNYGTTDGRNKPTQSPASRRRSNKELRKESAEFGTGRMSADQKWDFSKFESEFSGVVLNATQKLDDAKRKLTNYAGSLRNITSQLAAGDLSLRQDMDNLRRTSNSATELKEGIIAAMRNQFNFMRTALLTHNYELNRVMTSLDVLMDVTSDGFQSALVAHRTSMEKITHLNTTLTAVKKMVSAELRKRFKRMWGQRKGNKSRECPKEISAIGTGHSRKVDSQYGAYMVESYTPNVVTTAWIMKGSGKSDRLIEYDNAQDIDYGLVDKHISLPFTCLGTGHAVYRRHFYCHVEGTTTVVKYHLKKMNIVSEVILPGTHFTRYPYKSGQNTEVDIAVDELGLWVIYATEESGGKMVISKINHQRMEVEKTWVTKYLKTEVGNAFMICGVLYATNSHSDTPTFIRYMYDTETSSDRVLEAGQLPFPNSANLLSTKKTGRVEHLANSVMLNYDYRSSVLYSWSNSKVESFPVYFTKVTL